MFSTIADVCLIKLDPKRRADGELVVLEQGGQIPFDIKRVFSVSAVEGAIRGRHAHKQCKQLMVCLSGAIDVECDDGVEKKTFRLSQCDTAVYVPPSIWATETYLTAGAVLLVICDSFYYEDDYLRDYSKFLDWRKG